jgi:hypothetical protein
MSKKNAAKKAVNKNTRKKSCKVLKDECPNEVCPINKKKNQPPDNTWGQFLNFIFPSRTKNG